VDARPAQGIKRMKHFALAIGIAFSLLAVAPARGDSQSTVKSGVERDIAYLPGATPDQRLDLYLPQAARGFPTVVFFHGGSLQESGERSSSPMYAHVCEPFVRSGVACATVDYRLAPAYKWPAMPDDAAAAFHWVKTNIAARGGDPARVFVFGHSSGCHLAAILGANPKYLAKVGLEPSAIAGVVAMGCTLAPLEAFTSQVPMAELRRRWESQADERATYASFDDWLDFDPSRFLGPHMPPTLVVVAQAERFFPAILEQGAKFVRRLLELDRPADLVLVPGKHISSIQNINAPGDPTFAAIKKFIDDPSAAGRDSR
jgi:acetyl esterase/lipase